jgi:hypothetical protein
MRFHVLYQDFNPSKYQDPLLRGPLCSCISGPVSTESTYKRKEAVISERLEVDCQFVGDGGDDNTTVVVIVK